MAYDHTLLGIRKLETDDVRHYRSSADPLTGEQSMLGIRQAFNELHPDRIVSGRLVDRMFQRSGILLTEYVGDLDELGWREEVEPMDVVDVSLRETERAAMPIVWRAVHRGEQRDNRYRRIRVRARDLGMRGDAQMTGSHSGWSFKGLYLTSSDDPIEVECGRWDLVDLDEYGWRADDIE